MPRKARSENKNFYHFCLYLDNGARKYYFTALQIAQDLGCSRSSVYRALTTNNKLFEHGIIKKEYLHHTVVEHLIQKELELKGVNNSSLVVA